MHRIFADFNNADLYGRLRLNLNGSQRDIKEQNIRLFEGMAVILYDGEEFEIEGILEFSDFENIWVGKIDWSALEPSENKSSQYPP